jgi:spore maturation protein CgeB
MSLSAVVLCPEGSPWLLGSYGRALRSVGVDVHYWDFEAAMARHVKLGRVGALFSNFVGVEPWVTKANRDLVRLVLERSPSILVFAGALRIRAGALAQIKMSRPDTRIVMIWPDTLLNLTNQMITCLPVCDLVASYSSTAAHLLKKLGAPRVEWLPFAADTQLFPDSPLIGESDRLKYSCDVSFVGNHRPERERAVRSLTDAGMTVKVWGGNDWITAAADRERMRTVFGGEVLIAEKLVKAVQCSKISLNVIDATNYPAANMRFFELYACGGAPLSSACPEMLPEFPDGDLAVYFDESNLVSQARRMLDDTELRSGVAARGRKLTLAAHTYQHRAKRLLETLELVAGA